MIKDTKSLDGKNLTDLSFSSKARVIKICDLCHKECETSWNTIQRTRAKHKTDKDYCFKCAVIKYNSGNNNSAKHMQVRKKISKSLKGKSKAFKDGVNLRKLEYKKSSNGYLLKWSDALNTHVPEHRLIYSQHHNIDLKDLNQIHHIDGDKTNNDINNLIEVTNSEHTSMHAQLEKISFDLLKRNVIQFNYEQQKYCISPLIDLYTNEVSYGFEDIAIKQKKNICNSRLDVDTKSEVIRGVRLRHPLIAANMSTVVDSKFCIKLYKLGALGIMHRAADNEALLNAAKEISKSCDFTAMSIGVGDSQYILAKKLIKCGANIICIDVAHGFSDSVLELAKKIKRYYPDVKIIIGNTTNTDLLYESYDFIDAIKVGIAQGFACETKNTAGCTEKQFSAVYKFKNISTKFGIPIISDGGIREPADFTKAIAAGANSIMAGKIFAACPESAADLTHIDGKAKKVYAGMASRYVQNKWKGSLKDGTCPEGGVRLLDLGESVKKLLERYSGALKSGITYAGGRDIISFQKNVEFIRLK